MSIVQTAQAIDAFAALNTAQQLRMLMLFGHNLTIAARDTYEVQTTRVLVPERLRAINEIQHRVFGHMLALLAGNNERYPDEVVVSIMLEHSDAQLNAQALWAFQTALSKLGEEP